MDDIARGLSAALALIRTGDAELVGIAPHG